MTDSVGAVKITSEFDAEGIDVGIKKSEKRLDDLGRAAKKASDASKQIGNGAAEGALKLDSATRNSIRSIERQTLALGKSRSEYLAAKAAIDGNTAALAPYIAKLAEAEKAQDRSATIQRQIATAGIAAAATGTAIAAMVKNAIDAADALNDMSQRTGIAVKELSAYKLAADQSGASLEAVGKGMKKLATAMFENRDALKAAGITANDTNGALRQLADLFAELPDGAEKSAIATKLLGKAGEELIPLLNLGSKGLDESATAATRYASAMQMLAPQADQFNDTMSELSLNLQGMAAELAGELVPTLNQIAREMANASKASNEFSVAGATIKTVFETIAILGADLSFIFETLGKEIGGVAAELVALSRLDFRGAAFIRSEINRDAVEARARLDRYQQNILNPSKQLSGPSTFDARDLRLAGEAADEASKKARKLAQAVADAGSSAKTVKDEFGDLMSRLNAKDAGLDASFWKDLQTLNSGYKAGRIDIDEYRSAVEKLVTQQKFHTDALKVSAQAQEEARKAEAARLDAMMKSTDTLADQVKRAREENEEIGLTTEQLDALKLARMDATIAAKEQELATASLTSTSAAEIELLRDQVDALRELRNITASSAVKSANKKALDDQSKAWENFARDIEQSLTDALMRSFESGESFGEAFVKSLQNTIKAAVLKMAVQVVLQPITGQGGLLQQAAGAMGFGGNVANTASNAASLYGNVFGGSQMVGTMGSGLYGAFATSSIGQSLGLAAPLSEMAVGVESVGLTSLGSSIGAALPWIGGALAVGSLLGAFDEDEPDPEVSFASLPYGNGRPGVDTPFGPMRVVGKHMGDVGKDNETTAKEFADKFLTPLAAFDAELAKFMDDSQIAKATQDLQGWVSGDVNVDEKAGPWIEKMFAERLDVITDAIGGWVNDLADTAKGTLQETYTQVLAIMSVAEKDWAEEIATALLGDSSGEYVKSGETAAAAFARLAVTLDAVNTVLTELDSAAYEFGLSGADAAYQLTQLFGGLEGFASATAAYYEGYFSEAERIENLAKKLGTAFDDLDLAMPATRAEFRNIVEGLDLTTEAGRETFASLMNLAPAFGTVADAAESAAKKMIEASIKAAQDGQRKAEAAAGTAFDALSRAIDAEISRIETNRDTQIESIEAQLGPLNDLAAIADRLGSNLQSAIDRLRGVGANSMTIQAARRDIDAMLAAGTLPDEDRLSRALGVVTSDSEANYATREDWLRAQRVQAGKLEDLADLTEDQGKIAKRQLEALEEQKKAIEKAADDQITVLESQLQLAQDQLDALNGIDIGIGSLAEAFAKFELAMAGLGLAQDKTKEAVAKKTYTSAAGATYDIPTDTWTSADGMHSNTTANVKAALVEIGDTQGAKAVYDAAKSVGLSLNDVDRIAGLPPGTAEEWARQNGLPRFAIGTNYVPKDTIAMVHQGERIIPAADNRELIRRLNDNSNVIDITPLLAEIAALRAEVKAGQGAIASNTRQTKDLLDSTINGSNTLRTEAVA